MPNSEKRDVPRLKAFAAAHLVSKVKAGKITDDWHERTEARLRLAVASSRRSSIPTATCRPSSDSTVSLTGDRMFTGLLQCQEGRTLIFVDPTGREVAIPEDEIVEQAETPYPLMPPIFAEALSEEELHGLVRYLLTQT